jgi:mediator of RNA polymerase II transcription subunit 12
VDLTLGDGSETAQRRYGDASKIGGSRLKLEVSKDSVKGSTNGTDSPKALEAPQESQPVPIRGRPRLLFEANTRQLQGANDVPLVSAIRGGDNITGHAPLPMPRRPGQNPELSGRRLKTPATHTPAKKDVRPKPYVLEVPSAAPHYSGGNMLLSFCLKMAC